MRVERALAIALLLAVAGSGAACSRRAREPKRAEPLSGNAVWFTDAVQEGESGALETSLERFRCAAVFFSARRLTRGKDGGWMGADLSAPAQPLARIPVVLVLQTREDPLVTGGENRGEKFGDVLAREIAQTIARGSQFGPVRGVHLDLPFSGGTAEAHAQALTRARSALAHQLARTADSESGSMRAIPITYSIRRPPPSDEKHLAAVRALASRADGFVAFLFDEGGTADPGHVDSLGKPWWAAYVPGGRAIVRRGAATTGSSEVDEGAIDTLTDDPRMELRHDLPWAVEKGSGFSLRARRSVTAGGLTLAAGESVAFVQPPLADMIARFRSDTEKRKFALGRVVVFSGRGEDDRVFPVAALEDLIAGGSPVPRLRAWADRDGGRVRISAENAAPHASGVSRVQNWIEVDLAPARIGDVEPGGFDRWEAYDASGRSVSPGRATRIRFYETFVAPLERFEPARLRVRGAVPSPCCRMRSHAAAVAGGETSTDWALPEAGAPTAPAP